MADKLELILEAERRGILPESKRPLLEEARKRGLVPPSADNPAPSRAPVTAPLYIPDGQGGEIGVQGAERVELEQRLKERDKEADKAKEKRIANRGHLERALDFATFAGSAIPRTLTRGEYGLGDIAGAVNTKAGESVKAAERDFAEANEPMLETAAEYGEYALGIPGLSTMGAPLKGLGAAVAATRASPRGAVAGAIRGTGMQATANSIRPPAPPKPKPSMAGLPENIQTIPKRLEDIQAFRDLEMDPFAPATASQATARAMRTIEEIPIVGGTVRSPKQAAELQARDVQAGLARQLGAPETEEAAGNLVQRGLERYRGAGMTDIEPGTLRGQGIDPYQPVKAAQRMTAGQAENAQAAGPIRAAGQGGTAQTARGVTVPAARPANQVGLRRTNIEDLSPAELNRVIEAPSRTTSFATRAEALYESAWKRLPKGMRRDNSQNSNQIGWKNMQETMRQIGRETANQISGQGTIGGPLAERIMRARTHTNLSELRSIRTEIGRALSNFGDFEARLDRTQLKRLYAAASKDMEAGLTDLSNRAWLRTKSTGKDKISVQEARKADAALYEFRRADRYFRQGQARMDKFMQVLDAKTPNEAARKVVTALKEKTANPSMLREVAGVLRPEELNAFRGHVIAQLGTKRPGAKSAESIFNWNNWATDFNAIMDAPGGREFMTKGMAPEVAKRLENLARVVNRMKYYEQTTNYSGSAYSGIGVIALAEPMSAVYTLAGGAAAGKLFTSKPFLAWNEALMKAQLKAGNTAASNMRIAAQYAKRLPALAKANKLDPDLHQALIAFGQGMDMQLGGLEKQKALASPAP